MASFACPKDSELSKGESETEQVILPAVGTLEIKPPDKSEESEQGNVTAISEEDHSSLDCSVLSIRLHAVENLRYNRKVLKNEVYAIISSGENSYKFKLEIVNNRSDVRTGEDVSNREAELSGSSSGTDIKSIETNLVVHFRYRGDFRIDIIGNRTALRSLPGRIMARNPIGKTIMNKMHLEELTKIDSLLGSVTHEIDIKRTNLEKSKTLDQNRSNSVTNLRRKETINVQCSLELTKKEKAAGTLLLSYSLQSWDEYWESIAKDKNLLYKAVKGFPIPLLVLEINQNRAAGFILRCVDGKNFENFKTYQVNLWYVQEIFGENNFQGWNREYTNAKRIFSGPMSPVVRAELRTGHASLYNKSNTWAGRSKEVTIEGAAGFLSSIAGCCTDDETSDTVIVSKVKVDPAVIGKKYTYIVSKDHDFRFSETCIENHQIGQDLLSKHALHADASSKVIYAGEFFVDVKSEWAQSANKPRLVLDNNSGTYSPSKQNLGRLKALFEANFGEDFCCCFDREDDQLQVLKDLNSVK